MSNDPLANAIFNKIESNLFHVSRENTQEIFTKRDNIQNGLTDVNNVETRVDQLEQFMKRGQQGVVAQVTAEYITYTRRLRPSLTGRRVCCA
jgi:hypothetical protein